MSAAATAGETDMGAEFIIEAGTFGTFLDSVGALVSECKLRFTDGGLAVTAVTPDNVSMVDTVLETEAFESYDADGGVIGINIGRLQDIVGLGSAGDLLNVRLDGETRKLIVSGDGFEYDYATIDPDTIRREPDIPDLEHSSEFVIESDDLGRVEKGGDMVSDQITFDIDPDESMVCVVAEGDTDDLRFQFDEDDLVTVEELGDVASILSLDHFERVVDPMVGPVELTVDQEMPVTFDFEAPHGPVSYLTAPRIQNR